MKRDITTKYDIERLVKNFYTKLNAHADFEEYFSAVNINWETFLPTLQAFWENIIFFTGNYDGNPMQRHKLLHEHKPLKKELFNKWTEIFNSTVDELFQGEKATLIKQRANSIATVMQIKILNN